jgi:hypothetical protein
MIKADLYCGAEEDGAFKKGSIIFSWSVGKKLADNTQPPEKLHPPIFFYKACLEHI